jgi:aminoglycoside 3-N-acetyltransferase
MENPLCGFWADSGLNKGDTVLVHSSMIRVFQFLVHKGIKPNPGLVIDSLLHEIGSEGTLLLPLFNFDFTITSFFSMISTPSKMGRITEFARLNYEGYRTGHPIYSFYAIGQNSQEFKYLNNKSGYGTDSPFAKLVEMNGKVASIDLDDQSSMTFYHHVEEIIKVDYRIYKKFSGKYQNLSGEITDQEYELYVRDLEKGVLTDVNRMGEILWNEGLYKGNRPEIKNGMRTIDARRMLSRTAKEIVEGRAIETLYSMNGK